MELSCTLGTTCLIPPPQNFPESYIINPLLTKLVKSRWLDTGLVLFLFVSLWTLTLSWSTNMQKRTWPISSHLLPQTWSIPHMHYIQLNFSDIPNICCLVTGFHCTDNENYSCTSTAELKISSHLRRPKNGGDQHFSVKF